MPHSKAKAPVYRKSRRDRWRAEGRCTKCGRVVDGDYLHCSSCRAYFREWNAKQSDEHKAVRHARVETLREARRQNGLCPRCAGTPKNGRTYCAECINKRLLASLRNGGIERTKEWRKAHPDRTREYELKHDDKVRDIIFARYGTSCACCGESERVFLTLDHINGDGAAHRRELAGSSRVGGVNFYQKLIKAGLPDGIRTLCWNCNAARHRLGVCPHEVNCGNRDATTGT